MFSTVDYAIVLLVCLFGVAVVFIYGEVVVRIRQMRFEHERALRQEELREKQIQLSADIRLRELELQKERQDLGADIAKKRFDKQSESQRLESNAEVRALAAEQLKLAQGQKYGRVDGHTR